VWAAHSAPKFAPRLELPLGILATVVFVFLMWETRLVRAQAFGVIRGGGAILAMVLLLLLSMLIGWLIGGQIQNHGGFWRPPPACAVSSSFYMWRATAFRAPMCIWSQLSICR
jgi:hypothetical protein